MDRTVGYDREFECPRSLPIAVQRIVLENQADIPESSFRLLFTPQALLVGSSFLSDASGRKSVLETQRSPCLALVHRLINRFRECFSLLGRWAG